MLRRIVHRRVRLTNSDRIFFIRLYRWFPSILKVIAVIRPETLVRWHRAGFRRYWRWKSRSFGGRPQVVAELRALIRRMSVENPLWGAPRIHGELLKLGFEVAQSSVAKYMVERHGPPSQGWRTFLRNHAPDIAAMDLFIVPTIGFNPVYAFVVVRLDRRELVWINVTQNPTAEWIARQITEAFPWNESPRYLIRDRDRIYGEVALRRIRAMGIRDKPIAPASPWQNGFTERLIGSIRRECLDHLVILGEAHLRRILRNYASYYNKIRTHRSLDKDAPAFRSVQRVGTITSYTILGGLHHHYVRVWVFGTHRSSVQAKLEALEARQVALAAELAGSPEEPVRLHPNLAVIYKRKVAALHELLSDAATSTEAIEIARSLIDQVKFRPGADAGLEIELIGDLARMVQLAQDPGKNRPLPAAVPDEFARSVKVVAGVGFEPTTFRLWAWRATGLLHPAANAWFC
jgi:transposase InsO family protein